MDLADFLLACIAEDEAAARESGADAMVGWRWKHYPPEAYEEVQALTLAHSARTLADCEAKRRIVELATGAVCRLANRVADEWGTYSDTDADEDLLRLLALPYADHPDYDEEWKP